MRKLSLWLPLITLSLFLSSCASVPNVPICAEVNLSRGVCTYTASSKNIIVDDEHPLDGLTWFDIRTKSLTVPAASWAKIKEFLIKQCKKQGCNVDVSQWDRDLNP